MKSTLFLLTTTLLFSCTQNKAQYSDVAGADLKGKVKSLTITIYSNIKGDEKNWNISDNGDWVFKVTMHYNKDGMIEKRESVKGPVGMMKEADSSNVIFSYKDTAGRTSVEYDTKGNATEKTVQKWIDKKHFVVTTYGMDNTLRMTTDLWLTDSYREKVMEIKSYNEEKKLQWGHRYETTFNKDDIADYQKQIDLTNQQATDIYYDFDGVDSKGNAARVILRHKKEERPYQVIKRTFEYY